LSQIVLRDIKFHAEFAKIHENDLSKYAAEIMDRRQGNGTEVLQKKLDKDNARLSEIDDIIANLLTQNTTGKITTERFFQLLETFESEAKTLKSEVTRLENLITPDVREETNALKFLGLVKEYTEIEVLTVEIINTLIEKIVVFETVREGSDKRQRIDIYYNFIGLIRNNE
jgi:hypothetical protein